MKKVFLVFILSIFCLTVKAQKNFRMIVTTDIGGSDPDDIQSLIHLLVELDQVELEGIISQHAWVPYGTGADSVINSLIDGYEDVLPNLRVHSKAFPTADYLRSIVKIGQPEAAMAGVGDGKDSEGSEWIIRVVDKEDDRPVWISAWSGTNTLAQALWKVSHTRTPEQVNEFVKRIRVYDVLGQDDAGAWIVTNFPNLLYIRNTEVYGWGPSDEWVRDNVQSVSALGKLYPDRRWATEGDSPAFMYCLNNGLHTPDFPHYGGWGGRFSSQKVAGIRGMDWVTRAGLDETKYDPYLMIPAAEEGGNAISIWKEAIYNDFAARMSWCASSNFNDVNHHPVVVVNNRKGLRRIIRSHQTGSVQFFNPRQSYDPDGDKLSYNWIFYREASAYKGDLSMKVLKNGILKVKIPQHEENGSVHLILEVKDNGSPALTSYKRIVINF